MNGAENLVTKDMQRVLNAFFVVVFANMICLQESLVSETHGKVWSKLRLARSLTSDRT